MGFTGKVLVLGSWFCCLSTKVRIIQSYTNGFGISSSCLQFSLSAKCVGLSCGLNMLLCIRLFRPVTEGLTDPRHACRRALEADYHTLSRSSGSVRGPNTFLRQSDSSRTVIRSAAVYIVFSQRPQPENRTYQEKKSATEKGICKVEVGASQTRDTSHILRGC